MRKASFVGGFLLLAIGVGGLDGYLRLSDTASSSLSKSSLVSGSIDQAANLPPPIGTWVSRGGVQGIAFGVIALAGLILFLNGLRSSGTKLSVKEIRELGLGTR